MYVSDAMVKRLPAYYRHLKELERESVRQISTPSAACGNISVIFWGWIRPIR